MERNLQVKIIYSVRNIFEVNGIGLVCLSSQWRSTLQGKNLLPQEQVLSFNRRHPCERASLSKEANRKS